VLFDTILSSLISFIGVGGFFGGFMMGGPKIGIPSVGILGLLIGLMYLGFAIYAIYGAYRGFTGQDFEYAIIGDFIRKI
jgi:uncharacterized membrane protein